MTGQVKELSGPFAARLRAVMNERRIGTATLSRASDVSARLIHKYRSGEVEPRNSWGDPTVNAQKLAAALDVPLAELCPARTREGQAA